MNDSLMQVRSMARFSVSIWCAIYTQKLTWRAYETMIRYRGVKIHIISTPNRNEIHAIETHFHETMLVCCPCSASQCVRASFKCVSAH